MTADPAAVPAACRRIIAYLESSGRRGEVGPYQARLQVAVEEIRAADEARQGITQVDEFLPHGLDAGTLAGVVAQLRKIRAVKRAWLVRKDLEQEEWEDPIYVLAYERRRSLLRGLALMLGGWWILMLMKDPLVKLQQRLTTTLDMPEETYVMALKSQSKGLRRRITAVPGARIKG
jgi:hypothetical protein